MAYLAITLALLLGIAIGRASRSEATEYPELPQIIEDEPHEEPREEWGHVMPPDRYVQLHPAGPFAEQARRILNK